MQPCIRQMVLNLKWLISKLEKYLPEVVDNGKAYKRVIPKFSELDSKVLEVTKENINMHDVTFIFNLKYNFFN